MGSTWAMTASSVLLAVTMLLVILLFLFLGGLLHLFAFQKGAQWQNVVINGNEVSRLFLNGKDITADKLFPAMALKFTTTSLPLITTPMCRKTGVSRTA